MAEDTPKQSVPIQEQEGVIEDIEMIDEEGDDLVGSEEVEEASMPEKEPEKQSDSAAAKSVSIQAQLPPSSTLGTTAQRDVLDINTCTLDMLCQVLSYPNASAIVAARPYKVLEGVLSVAGIGPSRLSLLKKYGYVCLPRRGKREGDEDEQTGEALSISEIQEEGEPEPQLEPEPAITKTRGKSPSKGKGKQAEPSPSEHVRRIRNLLFEILTNSHKTKTKTTTTPKATPKLSTHAADFQKSIIQLHEEVQQYEQKVQQWREKKEEAEVQLSRAQTKRASLRRRLAKALQSLLTPEQKLLEELEANLREQSRLSFASKIDLQMMNDVVNLEPALLSQAVDLILKECRVFNFPYFIYCFLSSWKMSHEQAKSRAKKRAKTSEKASEQKRSEAEQPPIGPKLALIQAAYRLSAQYLQLQSKIDGPDSTMSATTAVDIVEIMSQFGSQQVEAFLHHLVRKTDDTDVIYSVYQVLNTIAVGREELKTSAVILKNKLLELIDGDLKLDVQQTGISYSRSASGLKCDCIDCQKLKSFLVHPTLVEYSFEVAKAEKMHLMRKLEWGNAGKDLEFHSTGFGHSRMLYVRKIGDTLVDMESKRAREKKMYLKLTGRVWGGADANAGGGGEVGEGSGVVVDEVMEEVVEEVVEEKEKVKEKDGEEEEEKVKSDKNGVVDGKFLDMVFGKEII